MSVPPRSSRVPSGITANPYMPPSAAAAYGRMPSGMTASKFYRDDQLMAQTAANYAARQNEISLARTAAAFDQQRLLSARTSQSYADAFERQRMLDLARTSSAYETARTAAASPMGMAYTRAAEDYAARMRQPPGQTSSNYPYMPAGTMASEYSSMHPRSLSQRLPQQPRF